MAEDVELADSLSTAMLLVLETLTPTQRAVFLLHDVFDVGYEELAEAVGKTEAAVRQIAHRARAQVAERRPRGETSRADTRLALEAFQRALDTGDLQGLVDIARSGRRDARRRWRDQAGAAAARSWAPTRWPGCWAPGSPRVVGAMAAELVQVNGWPALLLRLDGEVDSVMTMRVEEGLVTGIYTVRNPEKLSRILEVAELTR